MKKKDSGSSFATDVFTLVSGTTIAQIISIASAPLITRLYGADAFGLSALFSSLVGTISVIACLRYELTIMLPKTDEEAANLLALSLFITSVISLTLIPIIWLFGDDLASLVNASGLQPYLWLISPMVFLSGSFSAINYWNSRKREFGRLSKTQVARAATTSGAQLGVGYAGFTSGVTLIAASVVGQAVATSTLGYQVWKTDKGTLKNGVNWQSMTSGLRKYCDFPKVDIWSALINTLSLQLPIFILSVYFSSTIVGYYSLGMMILSLPASFIGSAMAQVFFQRASEAFNESKNKLTSIVEQVVKHLFTIGIFPFLLLSIVGADLFTIIFGPTWSEAGVYSQILAFWILTVFIASPISTIFTVMKELKIFLIFNVVLVIVRAGSLIWGGMNGDIYLSLVLFSLSGGFVWLVLGYWILKNTRVSIFHLIKSISTYLSMATILLLIILFCKFILSLDSLFIVVISVISLVLYYTTYYRSDDTIKDILASTVLERK
jgi:O-antigen/teichoic acid export membrane protein